jgi:hypothetical protein
MPKSYARQQTLRQSTGEGANISGIKHLTESAAPPALRIVKPFAQTMQSVATQRRVLCASTQPLAACSVESLATILTEANLGISGRSLSAVRPQHHSPPVDRPRSKLTTSVRITWPNLIVEDGRSGYFSLLGNARARRRFEQFSTDTQTPTGPLTHASYFSNVLFLQSSVIRQFPEVVIDFIVGPGLPIQFAIMCTVFHDQAARIFL